MKNQKILKINKHRLNIVLDDQFIYGIHWSKQSINSYKLTSLQKRLLNELESELTLYFDKKLQKFKTPIKLEGSEFQLNVWNELEKIPYAQLVSYKDLAIRIGNPNASRAVGTANSKNPISIIVPCHRVIQSTGEYGGYAGGESVKSRLIEHELGIS